MVVFIRASPETIHTAPFTAETDAVAARRWLLAADTATVRDIARCRRRFQIVKKTIAASTTDSSVSKLTNQVHMRIKSGASRL